MFIEQYAVDVYMEFNRNKIQFLKKNAYIYSRVTYRHLFRVDSPSINS